VCLSVAGNACSGYAFPLSHSFSLSFLRYYSLLLLCLLFLSLLSLVHGSARAACVCLIYCAPKRLGWPLLFLILIFTTNPRPPPCLRKYLRLQTYSFLHRRGDLPCPQKKNNNFHSNILSVCSLCASKEERARVCVV